MKIIKENNFSGIFPMKITCNRVVDEYGFAYGKKEDFCGSELEIDSNDIKKHKWSKYPDYSGDRLWSRLPFVWSIYFY